MHEHGGKVMCVEGDVSREADVQRLVDTVVGELGDIYAVSFPSPQFPLRPSVDAVTQEGHR